MKSYLEWRTVETPSGTITIIQATWEVTRLYRNLRLQESDIIVTRFAEAGLPVSDAWKAYREQLRNITDAFADPEQVVFPDAPPFEIPIDAVSQEERVAALELITDMIMDEEQA